MKIHSPVVVVAIATQAPRVPVSSGLDIARMFDFQENNFVRQSPAQNSFTNMFDKEQADKESSPFVAQGDHGGGEEKGANGKRAKGDEGGNNKCCTCTCYDTSDHSGDSRSYERGYDSGPIDGEDYCQCSCSCGYKQSMPLIPTVKPSSPPSPSPFQPTEAPVEPTPVPVEPTPAPTPTLAPIEPTSAPVSPTPPPDDCEIPSPIVPDMLATVNITSCNDQPVTIESSNNLIVLQNNITCGSNINSFVHVLGNNNTVDCGGFSVVGAAKKDGSIAFRFQNGSNNLIQNCPYISNFTNAIEVTRGGQLYAYNIAALNNDVGASVSGGEFYTWACDFSFNCDSGVDASGTLVMKDSSIRGDNGLRGVRIVADAMVCLERSTITGSFQEVGLDIRPVNPGGTSNVTLSNMAVCVDDGVSNSLDIIDGTTTTTVLDNVRCDVVRSGRAIINATEYGCVRC